MTKRLIDTTATELSSYSKSDLLTSIADSEGRTLAAETIGTVTPMLVNITNAEFVTSLGADHVKYFRCQSACNPGIATCITGRYYS